MNDYDYDYDFNKKLGYSVLNVDNNIKILCMKVEIENTEKENALNLFLNDKIKLVNANESKDKTYNKLYKELIELIKFEEEYLDNVYFSKYMKYFYTDDEIN